MYTTSKRWETFFYFSTWILQGSSFLVPRAYGILHRMHHVYSDTKKDPHSPLFFTSVWRMMVHTHHLFRGLVQRTIKPESQFVADYLPEWDRLDKFGSHVVTRLTFGAIYLSYYIYFAPNYFYFLLLPIHFFMGAVQGAIVNWCGHKYGYSNYGNGDHSRNTTPWGVVLMGELFQNNHHHDAQNANFANKWYEFDTTFQIMKVMQWAGIIKIVVPVG